MFKLRIVLLVAGWLLAGLVTRAPAADQVFVELDGQRVHPTRILAKYANQPAELSSAATLAGAGVTVKRRFKTMPGMVVLDERRGPALAGVPNAAVQVATLKARIAALRASGLFEFVEPDGERRLQALPNDTAFVNGTLWGLYNFGQAGGTVGADIGATNAWSITVGSTNVIVAVIDSGIRYTHRDLTNQMWRNPGEVSGNGLDDDGDGFVDNVFGINAITGSGDPMDDNGHGTHVSGTIGAAANDGNSHVGVNWNVRLMGCKFLSAQGGGSLSDAITCIDFAILKGAHVINASYGSSFPSLAELNAVVRARNAGILFVAAAGNNGEDSDQFPFYPASYKVDNVISVAALDRFDRLAVFSNYGRTNVHIGAPGVEIFSTWFTGDTNYNTIQGTSMAAPHVAGVGALIKAAFPNITVQEIRGRILAGAVPVPGLQNQSITGGRVNAYNSLVIGRDGILEVSVSPPSGSYILSGSTVTLVATVNDLLPVTNATVLATLPGVFTNVFLLNDGTNGTSGDLVANDNLYTTTFVAPAFRTNLTLTLEVTAPGATNSTNIFIYTVSPPPPNDNFAAAAKIPTVGGTVTGDNTFGSLETFEPVHAGAASVAASVWWTWAPTNSGRVLVDTAGSVFDTVVAVYTNNALPNLVAIASADDVGLKKQGHLFFNAVAGETYRIAVASANSNDFGAIRLRVDFGGLPDTTSPTVVVGSPTNGLFTTNGVLVVSGTADDFLEPGSGVKDVFVQLNSDLPAPATGSNVWTRSVFLAPGTNSVQVYARDFANNISPIVRFSVTYLELDPVNDYFHYPFDLQGITGSPTIFTGGASKEDQEPNHAGNAGGKSVWYRFIAPANGMLSLSTSNSTFDTLLAVYSGTSVSALTTLASNDDDGTNTYSHIDLGVTAGQTYRIAVDGVGGASGTVVLNFSFTDLTIYDVSLSVTGGGSIFPGSGSYTNGMRLTLTATPAPGFDFVTWQGAELTTDNPLTVTVSRNLSLTAVFMARTFADDFESGNLTKLPWANAGNAAWSAVLTNVAQTNIPLGGRYFARSGVIGDNQTSSLKLTALMYAGPASFAYRVSTEFGTQFADFFDFFVNNVQQIHTSGETGWLNYQFNLPAGTNTLEWRYARDQIGNGNQNAVFLDNVDLPLRVAKDTNSPATFSTVRLAADGNTLFRFAGQTNQLYVIEASGDLFNWQPLSTNVARHGLIQFTDLQGTNFPLRYYRAVVP